MLDEIKSSLERGENVLIVGFGKFSVNHKQARKVRNPATGEAMIHPARNVVRFKPSGKLKKRINGK